MKPRFKFRELVLVTSPLALFGAFIWWRTHVPSTPEIATTPPVPLNAGPFRIVLAPWQPLLPSAGELASGHTYKLGTRFWVAGATTGRLRHLNHAELTRDLHLDYKRNGRWQTVRASGGWNRLRSWTSEGDLSQRLDVALPMSSVPSDAKEVRLRGTLSAKVFERTQGDRVINLRSSPVDVLIKSKHLQGVFPPPREPSLQLKHINVALLGDTANAPNYSRILDQRASASIIVNAHVIAELRWNCPFWQKERSPFFTAQTIQLLDRSGHDWLLHKPSDESQNGVHNLGEMDKCINYRSQFSSQQAFWGADVNTNSIPLNVGELRLLALISPEWPDGTTDAPLQVETVIRPLWLTQRPRELALQKVNVAWGHTDGYPYGDKKKCPVVTADFVYTGTMPVFARGESESQCAIKTPTGYTSRLCWEDHDSASAQIPFGQSLMNKPLRQAKPGENELIVSWSHRVENKITHQIAPSCRSDKAVKVLAPQINGSKVHVTYTLNDWSASDGPQVFRADIGLRDQGLIPIAIEIPTNISSKSTP